MKHVFAGPTALGSRSMASEIPVKIGTEGRVASPADNVFLKDLGGGLDP